MDKDHSISPSVEMLLMMADRKDHVDNLINPNLDKGIWVISDRYLDSTIAYQGGGRQLDINLITYKKALFNSDFATENNLLKILKPIINSDSIWKSHALYLLGEYFLSKNEKKKSKEFFEKILIMENANSKIKLEAKKRIERDLGE